MRGKSRTTPKKTLTFYLLKISGHPDLSAIKADPAIKHYPLQIRPDLTLSLFTAPRLEHPPKWAPFFADYVDPKIFGVVNSASAVLLVPAGGRYFAFTFGQGRFLLNPEVCEDRFGLKVVLNSIGEKQLRSIDKEVILAIPVHAREQTGKDASALDFGLDVERDLLKAVTGTPTTNEIGDSLTGMDALRTHLPIQIEELPDLAERCLRRSESDSYKEKFPWIDHLSEVRDSSTLDILDQLLVEKLTQQELDDVWVACPGIVDWNSTGGFRYGRSSYNDEHYDLHIREMLDNLAENVSIEALRRKRILRIGDDGLEKDEWSYYSCLQCELDSGPESYLLSSAKWYRIETDFVRGVNKFYDQIDKADDLQLPEYNDESETAYNARVADSTNDLALMDSKLVSRETRRGDIEFCDLFSRSRDIIHVKRYGGSSPLSHLFAQGHVSGSALAGDSVFREDLAKKLPPGFRELAPIGRPEPNSFRVVFAIISQSKKILRLPLFSRLSLRHATRELIAYGFKVAITKIEVSENKRKIKKASGKRRKTF